MPEEWDFPRTYAQLWCQTERFRLVWEILRRHWHCLPAVAGVVFGLHENPCKDSPDEKNKLCMGCQLKKQTHLFHSVLSQSHGQQSHHNYFQQTASKNRINIKYLVVVKCLGIIKIRIWIVIANLQPYSVFLPKQNLFNWEVSEPAPHTAHECTNSQFTAIALHLFALSSDWGLKSAPSHYMLSLWTLSSVVSPYQLWPGLDLAEPLASEHQRGLRDANSCCWTSACVFASCVAKSLRKYFWNVSV